MTKEFDRMVLNGILATAFVFTLFAVAACAKKDETETCYGVETVIDDEEKMF